MANEQQTEEARLQWWEYETVLVKEGSAVEFDSTLQRMSEAGWRLHPVCFQTCDGTRVLTFEREALLWKRDKRYAEKHG